MAHMVPFYFAYPMCYLHVIVNKQKTNVEKLPFTKYSKKLVQTYSAWSSVITNIEQKTYYFGTTFHVVALGLLLLSCFSDSDRCVCLYGYWGLELVNRP